MICLYTFQMIIPLQLSFQMWTNQLQETLNSKTRGDACFKAKEFAVAIDCYTQVSLVLSWLSFTKVRKLGIIYL